MDWMTTFSLDTVRTEHWVQLGGEVGQHRGDVVHDGRGRPVRGPGRCPQQVLAGVWGARGGVSVRGRRREGVILVTLPHQVRLPLILGKRLLGIGLQSDGAESLVGEGHVEVTADIVTHHGHIARCHAGGHGVPARGQRLHGGGGPGQGPGARHLVAAEYLEILVPVPGQSPSRGVVWMIMNLHISRHWVLLVHLVLKGWELLPNRTWWLWYLLGAWMVLCCTMNTKSRILLRGGRLESRECLVEIMIQWLHRGGHVWIRVDIGLARLSVLTRIDLWWWMTTEAQLRVLGEEETIGRGLAPAYEYKWLPLECRSSSRLKSSGSASGL